MWCCWSWYAIQHGLCDQSRRIVKEKIKMRRLMMVMQRSMMQKRREAIVAFSACWRF